MVGKRLVSGGMVIGLCACGQAIDPAPADDSRSGAAPGAEVGSAAEIPPPPDVIVDAHGVRWIRGEPAQFSDQAGSQPAARNEPVVQEPYAKTFEEFAQQFRAIKLIAGYEYTSEQAPLELARVAYDHLTHPAEPANAFELSTPPSQTGEEERVARMGELTAVGTGNTAFPARSIVWSDFGCSGAMMGRGTMLTAAHCLYNTSSNTWNTADGLTRKPYFYAGENLDNTSNPKPYGTVSCTTIVVPQGWKDYSGSSFPATTAFWDFGIVDFKGEIWTGGGWVSCEDTKGDQTGWMGTTNPTATQLNTLITYNKGYPACLSASACANGGSLWSSTPPIMGRMYQGYVTGGFTGIDPTYSYILQTQIVTTNGQSGSPIYLNSSGYYIVGIYHGIDTNHSQRGLFRRMDSTFYNWLPANSYYF